MYEEKRCCCGGYIGGERHEVATDKAGELRRKQAVSIVDDRRLASEPVSQSRSLPPILSSSPYCSTPHSWCSNPFVSLNVMLNVTRWPSRSVSHSTPSQSKRIASG